MEIHPDLVLLLIDKDVRRGDVIVTMAGRAELQGSWLVNRPGTFHAVGISKPDKSAVVVREIQVIAAQRPFYPVRDADQRWPIQIVAQCRAGCGCKDWIGSQTHCV